MRLPTNSIEDSLARTRTEMPPIPMNSATPTHKAPMANSRCGRAKDTVLCVRRNENVPTDVNAGSGPFLERDDGKPVQEVIQNLLTFGSGLFGDSVAYLGRRCENAPVITDLRETAQSATGGSRTER